jgi:hypothetical protein
VGADVAATRVHHDAHADSVARRHHADAVTVGNEVFFRQGQYRPDDPAGFQLLAHEATHVAAASRPERASARTTPGGREHEEHLAGTTERRAAIDTMSYTRPLTPPRSTQFGGFAPASVGPVLPAQPQAHHAAQPMAAPTERTATPPDSPLDLDALRRSLIQDIRRELRVEFERGA